MATSDQNIDRKGAASDIRSRYRFHDGVDTPIILSKPKREFAVDDHDPDVLEDSLPIRMV
jgi:hypothetical protein